MSDTILNGDVTIHYSDDNRRKQFAWTGSAGEFYTLNQLYSAIGEHFDELLQMDDGFPIKADTPVEYKWGIVDVGDKDPWYISFELMEHMKGGSLYTSGWDRVTDVNTGIIVVAVTSNNIVTADIGLDIDGATTGHGTLLEVLEAGTTDYLVIRPNSSAASDDFTTDTQTITCNAHTASQSGAASFDGEMIWANLYSIGTIESDTHIYLYQGAVGDDERLRVYSKYDNTQDWWGDGHIDICVPIKDHTGANFPVVDGGYITVLARKYTTLFDNFEVSCSTTAGGRNPIPLATAPDLDNTTGYKSVTFSGDNWTAGWSVGDEFEGDTSGARGIITKIDNPGSTQTVHYYLIDDPQTDFQADENVTNNDDTGTGDIDGSGPTSQGPALSTWFTSNTVPTVAYANITADIDSDDTSEGYGITIDCNANPLSEVYEWAKYVMRRGNTNTSQGDGLEAEQYIGAEVYLEYTGSVSGGTIAEGDDVLQATTNATGVVISHDTTLKQILLRNTRGTFNTTNTVTSQDNSGSITPDAAADKFAPKKQSPLGTFAGGIYFGARGVLLQDWVAADENSFQLTDSDGNIRERPTAISIEVTNLVGTDETTTTDDRIAVFRLTGSGGGIDKTEFSAYGGESIGDTTLDVDTAIPVDVPGKTTGGVLRIRDASDSNKEYRLRFSSWANNGGGGSDGRFTLANIDIASADSGTDADTIVEAGAFTTAKRGDIVYNHDVSAVSYVVSVDDANTVQISPAITGQDPGDHIELNCVPIAMDTADDVFVPLIDKYATAAAASVSIVYSAPIYFRVKVRNVENATPIIPFSADDSTSGTDRSIATIRTPDTIGSYS